MRTSWAASTSLLAGRWQGSAVNNETCLHQLSPYIGKTKSTMAGALISAFTLPGDTVYDPFCGSGTIALEAWKQGRNVVANDLNPYAYVLTRGKLEPPCSLESAHKEIDRIRPEVKKLHAQVDLRRTPKWVRAFFHPETLRDALAWFSVLRPRRSYFLLSCLLGILHHQRPGFLSFPSSHVIPYLRKKKFPRELYPDLYHYRPVYPRLVDKVNRAFRRFPDLDFGLTRTCRRGDAAIYHPSRKVVAIVTSPPYMRQLDYGRDNRLRLWFLGVSNPSCLDQWISPRRDDFLMLMRRSLRLWKEILPQEGVCVLIVGNVVSRSLRTSLPEAVRAIVTDEVGGFREILSLADHLPDFRRVRRSCRGCEAETVLVLQRKE